MDFVQVIQTCLDFSVARGGTIASFPPGEEMLQIDSRTTRTEILVERDMETPNGWYVEHKQNHAGERMNSGRERVCTEDALIFSIARFWDPPGALAAQQQYALAPDPWSEL